MTKVAPHVMHLSSKGGTGSWRLERSSSEGSGRDLMEDDLRVVADDGVVRVVFSGAFSLVAAKQALQKTVDACRENRCKRVLFDCRPMRGEISTMDRYEIGTYGGTAIPHGVMVALVARENQISPDKFLENVAVNRGVNLRVFSNLKQAADWLGR